MIHTIEGICIGIISGLVFLYLTEKFPKKIKCCDEGWKPIETFPHNTKMGQYLLSDGFDTFRGSFSPSYNKDGKILCRYDDTIATHWREFPRPPCTKIEAKND